MSISRGEVWLVNLDPTIGDEIRKMRPAVVVSRDALGEPVYRSGAGRRAKAVGQRLPGLRRPCSPCFYTPRD